MHPADPSRVNLLLAEPLQNLAPLTWGLATPKVGLAKPFQRLAMIWPQRLYLPLKWRPGFVSVTRGSENRRMEGRIRILWPQNSPLAKMRDAGEPPAILR